MRAGGVGSVNVVVDTDFFALGVAKFPVNDLRPDGFPIRELRRYVLVVIVLADRVSLLTAEDAADRVRQSAAGWKRRTGREITCVAELCRYTGLSSPAVGLTVLV
jgi:hypothetical protein